MQCNGDIPGNGGKQTTEVTLPTSFKALGKPVANTTEKA